ARHRRNHRRQPARRAPRYARCAHRGKKYRRRYRVVPRPAPLRHRAARGVWSRLRATAELCHRHGKYPRRDSVPACAGECVVLKVRVNAVFARQRDRVLSRHLIKPDANEAAMTDYKNITLTQQDKIATLTLNRPEQLNALSPDLFAEAVHALEGIAASRDIGVVILAANGRAFCAGADLKVFTKPDFTKEQATEYTRNADRFATLLETMPQATIARVHGICFTGGLEVSLGCDFMIAAHEA